ncbi:hypothetical protein V1498_03795 [Peribacillus sp. SCS-26]|uniref:hypothetical protein n=1 Tax=Paraperibacillus marinus TaxID=3115295 RepID=UPI003905AA1C
MNIRGSRLKYWLAFIRNRILTELEHSFAAMLDPCTQRPDALSLPGRDAPVLHGTEVPLCDKTCCHPRM